MPYIKSTDPTTLENKIQSSKPIRILHVVGGMDRGGVETWLMHILRNIDRQQFQMDFVVHEDRQFIHTEELQLLGCQIFPCLQPSQPWLYAANFKRILKEHGPYDAVHAHVHLFSGYVLQLAKQAGVKIRIIHSHIDTSSVEVQEKWQRQLYNGLMKWWIAKSATNGLACSRVAAANLFGSAWETNARWQLLYYGIDLAPFRNAINPAEVRAEFGIPEDAFVIGHVGRFETQKNHHFLVEIAAEIAKREPNMRLILMGVGSLRPQIEAKVTRMGLADRVIFGGSRPDIPRLMRGIMDVFLCPSLYEGLCLVAIEAQSAGLPCIFSDVIAEEADIVKPLIQRVSLSETTAYWSEVVLANKTNQPFITKLDALDILAKSVFNIEVSLQQLTKFYVYATLHS